jgi:hypothetical protein
MKIYYVGNSETGYRDEFYNLSDAKKAMKANNCNWSEIVKVYSNGDWVNCGEIKLNGSNKTFVANTRQKVASY